MNRTLFNQDDSVERRLSNLINTTDLSVVTRALRLMVSLAMVVVCLGVSPLVWAQDGDDDAPTVDASPQDAAALEGLTIAAVRVQGNRRVESSSVTRQLRLAATAQLRSSKTLPRRSSLKTQPTLMLLKR